MKALILAAGKGTRVQPITYTVPKPMIQILNKPVMEILVELLARHDVTEVMVNTSYLAPTIESYFRDGARFGIQMGYSFEGRLEDGRLVDEPVGSAGAIRKIQDHSGFFDETFVVLCGDAVVDLDLSHLLEFHRQKQAVATIALTDVPREDVSNYGVVVTEKDGRILEFQEKPPTATAKSTTVNTGIYVIEPEVIDLIPPNAPYDIGGQLFPKLVKTGARFYGATIPFRWQDIGKVADYYQVTQSALLGNVPGVRIPGREVAPGASFGLNVRADLATLEWSAPLYVGSSATIEPGCSIIGPTMIGAGCFIESGARIERSLIFDYTRIGAAAEVSGMMVSGRYCVDSSGSTIDLSKTDIDWVISDARSAKKTLTEDQRLLLEALQGR